MNFIVACLCLIVTIVSAAVKPTKLVLGIVHKYTTNPGEDRVFCFNQSSHDNNPWSIFEDTLIIVNETNAQRLAWHSVKGVSTDDLHAHLEHAVYWLADKLQPGTVHHKHSEPLDMDSILRDVSSACPSALFARSRSRCAMRFSTFGNACITVKAPIKPGTHLHLQVYVEQRYNEHYQYHLVVGAALVLLAGFMAKSKVFQYSAGAIAFVVGGVLILFLMLVNYIVKARNKVASVVRKVGVALLVSGVYGASLLWYLRNHWHSLALHYWEYVLGYVVVSAVTGLVVVQIVRKDEQQKHKLIVAAKWVIRIIGVVMLYNASASPLASLVIISITGALYIAYMMYKWVFSRLFSKPDSQKVKDE